MLARAGLLQALKALQQFRRRRAGIAEADIVAQARVEPLEMNLVAIAAARGRLLAHCPQAGPGGAQYGDQCTASGL